ncbi:MAG: bifunctional alpha/beta hydrolase/OsmC family protein [Geminicoccaceae bacterium]
MPGSTREAIIVNQAGDKLSARLDLPAGRPRAAALFAHCFTCSKDIFAASRISQELADLGFAVLRFDFTGLGASEGEFANSNFSSNIDDLVAAADFMRSEVEAPRLLIGHSLGGAAVLAAAASVPEAVAVATIGAPFDPGHVAHLFQSAADEIAAKGEADVLIAGRPFTVKKQFLDDIAAHNASAYIADLKKALLVFHAPRDTVVGIDNAAEIFKAAKHPKSFVSLDDADHLLSKRADAIYVADVLAAWAARYLPAAEPAEAGRIPALGEVVVSETGEGKFTQTVQAGSHHLIADEPTSLGGDDKGPGPYDYVLAGLGACTAMTVRLYADRKNWPLTRVTVGLSHKKIHAEDCADCETKDGKLDEIDRWLTFDGDLDEDQRARLLEIADKCPVHRTLTGEVKIRSRLGERGEVSSS